MPWRTHLAVIVSIAAIAGCGQSSGPSHAGASDLSSTTTGRGPDVAVRPSGTGSGQQDPGDGATPDSDRGPGSSGGTEGSDDEGSRADEERNGRRQPGPVSEATSATPGVAELQPQASPPPPEPDSDDSGAEDDDETDADIDALEHTVVALLGAARQDAGAPQLQMDANLVEDTRDRACTMARGATPLLPEDDYENIGLVVEPEPDAAARAMHAWWMQSSRTRSIRMAETFTRYGVGACTAGDRVYYSERFGP